jgi:hypothetical protein
MDDKTCFDELERMKQLIDDTVLQYFERHYDLESWGYSLCGDLHSDGYKSEYTVSIFHPTIFINEDNDAKIRH